MDLPPALTVDQLRNAVQTEHYLNAARIELVAFESFVTDWERVRGFERL